jgi:hypothetical protein
VWAKCLWWFYWAVLDRMGGRHAGKGTNGRDFTWKRVWLFIWKLLEEQRESVNRQWSTSLGLGAVTHISNSCTGCKIRYFSWDSENPLNDHFDVTWTGTSVTYSIIIILLFASSQDRQCMYVYMYYYYYYYYLFIYLFISSMLHYHTSVILHAWLGHLCKVLMLT